MDYKEKVIALLNDQELPKEQKEKLENIFPELKESDDERMLREIKRYIQEQGDKPTGLPNGTVPVSDMITWLEKQGENKPTENAEIKFCEGDKVVSNQNEKVYTVGTAYYIIGDGEDICLHDTDGNHLWTNRDDLNNDYHLWSINDAKDGDVLVAKDDRPFIFTGEFDVQDDNPTAYCGINSNDKFITGKGSHWTFKDGIKPATKEQQDLLFAKMKEAGYEWDGNKKELKKMEIKSKNFEPKTLDADKVIEWLKPYSVIEDNIINEFKKDFGL